MYTVAVTPAGMAIVLPDDPVTCIVATYAVLLKTTYVFCAPLGVVSVKLAPTPPLDSCNTAQIAWLLASVGVAPFK